MQADVLLSVVEKSVLNNPEMCEKGKKLNSGIPACSWFFLSVTIELYGEAKSVSQTTDRAKSIPTSEQPTAGENS